MKNEIKFGTDGWRAITDKIFTEENVKIATIAIGKYVYETFGANKKIIIGYDPRYKADFFANFSAQILKDLGFEILLSEKIIPTPILAFQAKDTFKVTRTALLSSLARNRNTFISTFCTIKITCC